MAPVSVQQRRLACMLPVMQSVAREEPVANGVFEAFAGRQPPQLRYSFCLQHSRVPYFQ